MRGAKKGTNLLILKGAQIYLYPEQLLSDSKEEFPMIGRNIGSNKERTSRECSNNGIFNRQLSEKEKKIIESIHTAVGEKITKYEELRKKTDGVQNIIDFFQTWKVYLDDIITTNYDTNIEYCLDNEVSTVHRNLDSLNSIAHKNKVFKIHGCINDIEAENSTRIIITEKDYNNFKSKNKYLFYKVYSFFTEVISLITSQRRINSLNMLMKDTSKSLSSIMLC